jgi:hypothetical protein
MKDQKKNVVTRESALGFAKLVSDSFQDIRNSLRSSDVYSFACEDMAENIDLSIFKKDDNIFLELNDFIIRSLSCQSMLECLSSMEKFFHPIIQDLNTKIAPNLNCLSLRYLVKMENTR